MFDFLEYLAKGNLTPGERELAFNLTVIYGLSVLSMVIFYRVLSRTLATDKRNVEAYLPTLEQTFNLVKTRRSIMPKDYNGDKLTDGQVELLLEAANWAPTHKRNEPWRFVVLSDTTSILDYLQFIEAWYSDHREEISDQEYASFEAKFQGALKDWPENLSHAIVICMKREAVAGRRLPEWEEVSAVASAVQNMHLALTAVPGAAGFWSSHTFCSRARDSEQMLERLGLDPEDRVFGAFVCGRVDSTDKFRSARGDWREKVTWIGGQE